jgi:redox-sensitive bicupin YhaK (pirin superfamily)
VRSLFSYHEGDAFDPFLLLDYAEPYEFGPSEAVRGVGEHPHRGFETVTIVYQGELEHRDSSGNHGSIGPGDVQWMTAASGVVHEEYHSERFSRAGGLFEVAQLWVNLPAREKMSPPRYQEIRSAQIPAVTLGDQAGTVRVIAGEFQGVPGPARTVTSINVWDLELNSGKGVELPVADGHTTILIVQRGTVLVNGSTELAAVELARFDRSTGPINLRIQADSRALFLSGQPLGEPIVAQGPFVMNTREEIYQAIKDYQAGQMGHLA